MNVLTLSNPGKREERVDEEKAQALVERWESELAGATDFHVLDLHDRVYLPGAATKIAEFLVGRVSAIKEARLNDVIASLPTDQGLAVLKTLSEALKDAPIERLDLSDNALGIRGVEAASELLSVPTLKHLYLENDGLDTQSMEVIANILTTDRDGRCVCDSLESLRIYNNMIGVEGARHTGKILARCRELKEFRYEGCRPLAEGCQAIAEGLFEMSRHNDGLKTVLLEGSYGSSVDDDPVGDLCRALGRMVGLTKVRLGDCGLEEEGAKAAISALGYQEGLVELELQENEIVPTCMKDLVTLVKNNAETLEKLNLEGNELTSIGVEKLVRAFQDKKSCLRELKLGANQIGTRGARALMASCDELPMLEHLLIDGNGFTDEVVADLEATFGKKLQQMEENDDDDVDEDLDDEDHQGGDDTSETDEDDDEEVEELTQDLRKKLTPDDVSI